MGFGLDKQAWRCAGRVPAFVEQRQNHGVHSEVSEFLCVIREQGIGVDEADGVSCKCLVNDTMRADLVQSMSAW